MNITLLKQNIMSIGYIFNNMYVLSMKYDIIGYIHLLSYSANQMQPKCISLVSLNVQISNNGSVRVQVQFKVIVNVGQGENNWKKFSYFRKKKGLHLNKNHLRPYLTLISMQYINCLMVMTLFVCCYFSKLFHQFHLFLAFGFCRVGQSFYHVLKVYTIFVGVQRADFRTICLFLVL